VTKRLGLSAMLMINDYDEGRALANATPPAASSRSPNWPTRCGSSSNASACALPRVRRAPPFELFDPS